MFLMIFSSRLPAQETRSGYQQFIDSVAKSLYFLAWPTATYESVEFDDVEFVPSGADVSFRLHGRSGFNDGPLWVDVVIEVRNGQITDLHWGRNNAILAQPGTTIKALAEELDRINRENSGSSSPSLHSAPAAGYGYRFSNRCSRSVELAIHYLDSTGTWKTEGWWAFGPGESAFLTDDGRRLTSKNATWYYYARTTDNAWEWSGKNNFTVNGKVFGMREMSDTEGDSEWFVTCQ
jgi:uncharacterized membrane protein